MVVHIGRGPNHGHYVAVVKSGGRWLLFDDEIVELVNEQVRVVKGACVRSCPCAHVFAYACACAPVELSATYSTNVMPLMPREALPRHASLRYVPCAQLRVGRLCVSLSRLCTGAEAMLRAGTPSGNRDQHRLSSTVRLRRVTRNAQISDFAVVPPVCVFRVCAFLFNHHHLHHHHR